MAEIQSWPYLSLKHQQRIINRIRQQRLNAAKLCHPFNTAQEPPA
jgi:hypothetical protein